MKSIANQYRDLKEGKMSQANFMRNLRMSMPQYITNVTSFNDAVKILKNKRILNESHEGNDQWFDAFQSAIDNMDMSVAAYNFVMKALDHVDPTKEYGDMRADLAAKQFVDDVIGEFQQNAKDAALEDEDEDEDIAAMEEDLPGMAGGMHGSEDFRKAMGIEDDSPYEDDDEDDELAAMVAKAEEEEFGPEKYKFQDFPGGISEAEEFFPRSPIKMAELIAQKHGNELKNLSGRDRQKMALSKAYEEIYYSDHPKANVIAKNLVWGYADEDWPMDYITALNNILRDDVDLYPGNMGDEMSAPREGKINEYEHTYRKIDGVCYKIDDEGNRTRVADHYCRYSEDLNEAKKKKEAKAELHPNQVHPQELRMGIKVELEHTDDLDKAKKIALDHLKENPFYYTALKLAGVESPSAPKVKAPVEKKARKKKEAVELVDKANAMQKVKMPKADEKKKLKEARLNIDGEPNAVVKQAMGYVDGPNANPTLKALSSEIEFQQTQDPNEALLRYGYWKRLPEEAIQKLELQFNVEEDSDSDEDTGIIYVYRLTPKNKGGVKDLGASFDKFKSQLEEIVREVVIEYYDGRDNLDAETEK